MCFFCFCLVLFFVSLFLFLFFEEFLTLGTEQLGGTADTTKKPKAGSRGKRKVKKRHGAGGASRMNKPCCTCGTQFRTFL